MSTGIGICTCTEEIKILNSQIKRIEVSLHKYTTIIRDQINDSSEENVDVYNVDDTELLRLVSEKTHLANELQFLEEKMSLYEQHRNSCPGEMEMNTKIHQNSSIDVTSLMNRLPTLKGFRQQMAKEKSVSTLRIWSDLLHLLPDNADPYVPNSWTDPVNLSSEQTVSRNVLNNIIDKIKENSIQVETEDLLSIDGDDLCFGIEFTTDLSLNEVLSFSTRKNGKVRIVEIERKGSKYSFSCDFYIENLQEVGEKFLKDNAHPVKLITECIWKSL